MITYSHTQRPIPQTTFCVIGLMTLTITEIVILTHL